MNTKNPNTACEHGHQRRKCPYCELDELRQKIDAVKALVTKFDNYSENASKLGRHTSALAFCQCAEDLWLVLTGLMNTSTGPDGGN